MILPLTRDPKLLSPFLMAVGPIFVAVGVLGPVFSRDPNVRADGPMLVGFGLLLLVAGVLIRPRASAKRESAGGGVQAQQQVVPQVQQQAAPREESAPEQGAPVVRQADDASQLSPREELARLIAGSHNPRAAMENLVANKRNRSAARFRHVSAALEASGITRCTDTPNLRVFLLSRNDRYWFAIDHGLDQETYDALTAAEAALNMSIYLPQKIGRLTFENPDAVAETQRYLSFMMGVTSRCKKPSAQELEATYGKGFDQETSEWGVRNAIARNMECLPLVFRVLFDMRVNLANGTAYLAVETPRPRCMAAITGRDNQAGEARAYAFRSAVIAATVAFRSSRLIERVFVVCHEQGGEGLSLLRIEATPDTIDELGAQARVLTLGSEALPEGDAFRYSLGEDGWFEPLPKSDVVDFELFSPAWRTRPVELRDERLSAELSELTGAATVRDLSIDEDAVRIDAWNDVVRSLGEDDTTASVVSRLVALAEATDDQSVREACDRTCDLLVSGELDVTDRRALAAAFVQGSALDRAVFDSLEKVNGSDDYDSAAVFGILSSTLDLLMSSGAYADSEAVAWRYFNSKIDRIGFNRRGGAGGREVRLVPDAYYTALSLASRSAQRLGKADDAQRYAQEMLRVSENYADATMRMVSILEEQEKILDSVDLLKRALLRVQTPQDTAFLFYRLAYMEWKLGSEDLAVACYQRSLEWHSRAEDAARGELEGLTSIEGVPQPFKTAEEVHARLEADDIPLGFSWADLDRIMKIAVRAADEGIFPLASVCTSLYATFGADGDDVISAIASSLGDRAVGEA